MPAMPITVAPPQQRNPIGRGILKRQELQRQGRLDAQNKAVQDQQIAASQQNVLASQEGVRSSQQTSQDASLAAEIDGRTKEQKLLGMQEELEMKKETLKRMRTFTAEQENAIASLGTLTNLYNTMPRSERAAFMQKVLGPMLKIAYPEFESVDFAFKVETGVAPTDIQAVSDQLTKFRGTGTNISVSEAQRARKTIKEALDDGLISPAEAKDMNSRVAAAFNFKADADEAAAKKEIQEGKVAQAREGDEFRKQVPNVVDRMRIKAGQPVTAEKVSQERRGKGWDNYMKGHRERTTKKYEPLQARLPGEDPLFNIDLSRAALKMINIWETALAGDEEKAGFKMQEVAKEWINSVDPIDDALTGTARADAITKREDERKRRDKAISEEFNKIIRFIIK